MHTSLTDPGQGWPEPTVLDSLAATPILVARHVGVTTSDLPSLFDESYPLVAQAAAEAGATLGGPAVACFEGDPNGRFSIEIGFPFTGADSAVGATVSALPGPRVAVLTHVGPYPDLPLSWERLMGFVAEQGLTAGARYGELYVTDPTPETDPATLRTDLFVELV